MGRKVDVDDIINAAEVADLIGLSHRNGVYQYRHRHPDFPAPLITHGRCYMWHRGDIKRWIRATKETMSQEPERELRYSVSHSGWFWELRMLEPISDISARWHRLHLRPESLRERIP